MGKEGIVFSLIRPAQWQKEHVGITRVPLAVLTLWRESYFTQSQRNNLEISAFLYCAQRIQTADLAFRMPLTYVYMDQAFTAYLSAGQKKTLVFCNPSFSDVLLYLLYTSDILVKWE